MRKIQRSADTFRVRENGVDVTSREPNVVALTGGLWENDFSENSVSKRRPITAVDRVARVDNDDTATTWGPPVRRLT